MPNLAQLERHALCDTLLEVGPDAPTLSAPWLARDLAAHLVVRDGRPDAVLGRLLPPLAGRAEQVQAGYAARPWPELVDLVRSGPPWWSPVRLPPLDEAVNTSEFFLHHEDLLRAGPVFSRRRLSDRLEATLWRQLAWLAPPALSKAPTGVTLEAPGLGRRQVRKPTDQGTVLLTGTPGELTLYTSGRQRVAEVVLDGSQAASAAFARTPLGFA